MAHKNIAMSWQQNKNLYLKKTFKVFLLEIDRGYIYLMVIFSLSPLNLNGHQP